MQFTIASFTSPTIVDTVDWPRPAISDIILYKNNHHDQDDKGTNLDDIPVRLAPHILPFAPTCDVCEKE